ncbi:type IV toxin-antitoxin system AbiEi family antitoxin domain-containing protein [Kineosporia babensis]|uniref:Type IV toxin-antitoxin system AbiEi family antitoxin domain-containing protein n=1 Tax=Kineosporia babensis TaxID=499548 RepID=A0A9X1N9I5_9ACTN|nr:type IV toxin-antitoxin system AbiEi family antitoxin domain-containing protein [Kineosporia babensis]MCD5309691.1 type IV toxin-antitoxin system AbiEi family antitoxin domain-containing protein [Kineosporia babensis]
MLENTAFEELTALLGPVFTTQEAVTAGLAKSELARAAQRQHLVRLRRGVYTSAAAWQEQAPQGRHILQVMADQRVRPEAVACAFSAAVLLDLPTPLNRPPARVYSTLPRTTLNRGETGPGEGALVRRAWLSKQDVLTLANGIRVTSAPRTVWDCGRHWPRPWALAIADAALARGHCDLPVLQRRIAEQIAAPGAQNVRWAVRHADPRAESPLESLARARLMMAGLPPVQPQVRIRTRRGIYRVDLFDEANQIVIEADGRIKYLAGEDLWKEKRREDALREVGLRVVRFTMQDHHNPTPFLATYRSLLPLQPPSQLQLHQR